MATIREIRERRAMTLQQLATAAVIPYIRMRSIEWGECVPTAREYAAIRRALGWKLPFAGIGHLAARQKETSKENN